MTSHLRSLSGQTIQTDFFSVSKSPKGGLTEFQAKLQINRTHFSYLTAEKRFQILEAKKKKKIKDLENLLHTHKKTVNNRIRAYEHQNNITQANHTKLQKILLNNSEKKQFNSLHTQSLNSSRFNLLFTNKEISSKQRTQQDQFHLMILNEKNVDLQQKKEKRNRVRNMQFGNQLRVNKYWDNRVDEMKNRRKEQLNKNLEKHRQTRTQLDAIVRKTGQVGNQLQSLEKTKQSLAKRMDNERKMRGNDLKKIYQPAILRT